MVEKSNKLKFCTKYSHDLKTPVHYAHDVKRALGEKNSNINWTYYLCYGTTGTDSYQIYY